MNRSPKGTLSFDTYFPVELISFIASTNSKNVNLNWHTATEVNNYGFEIECAFVNTSSAIRNILFERIGFVPGYGNCNSPKNYSFIDNKITKPDKYGYRLKQIDTDGKFAFYLHSMTEY